MVAGLYCDSLYQGGKQFRIELIQPVRALVKNIYCLPQILHCLADVIVSQQSPAFGPELGQLSIRAASLAAQASVSSKPLVRVC